MKRGVERVFLDDIKQYQKKLPVSKKTQYLIVSLQRKAPS
jgi:hypothetical protein